MNITSNIEHERREQMTVYSKFKFVQSTYHSLKSCCLPVVGNTSSSSSNWKSNSSLVSLLLSLLKLGDSCTALLWLGFDFSLLPSVDCFGSFSLLSESRFSRPFRFTWISNSHLIPDINFFLRGINLNADKVDLISCILLRRDKIITVLIHIKDTVRYIEFDVKNIMKKHLVRQTIILTGMKNLNFFQYLKV